MTAYQHEFKPGTRATIEMTGTFVTPTKAPEESLAFLPDGSLYDILFSRADGRLSFFQDAKVTLHKPPEPQTVIALITARVPCVYEYPHVFMKEAGAAMWISSTGQRFLWKDFEDVNILYTSDEL